MNVLIIGGTRFVGRHITNVLCERGYNVAHFNRGVSDPEGRPDVEGIYGDRATDIARVGNRFWDAVIDMCGFTPATVEASARYFSGHAGRYVFFSSISVYDLDRTSAPDEDAPVMRMPEGADISVLSPEHYGALKALCESAVISAFRHRATILRPTLIAGPYDPTDRFTYWPVRFAGEGEILAPQPTHRVQYTDARDLAEFCARAVEKNIAGVYNCTVPPGTTFGDVFAACTPSNATPSLPVCVSDEVLLEQGVAPWTDLPLWVPGTPEYAGVANANSARAISEGLTFRPLTETVRDTLAWAQSAGKRFGTLEAGLSPDREKALLQKIRD